MSSSHHTKETIMNAAPIDSYRGFAVYFSTGNNAYNAKPVEHTAARHPGFVPVAAPRIAELVAAIDFQYAEEGRKSSWWESN